MKLIKIYFFSILILSIIIGCSSKTVEKKSLEYVPLSVGAYLIDVQVADKNEDRLEGLMFKKELNENQGMFFIFDKIEKQCFWMKNTIIPLSAAFIDKDGVIVNIVNMKPETLNLHCSVKPVPYVLEMQDSWFDKRDIKEGTKLEGSVFKFNPREVNP